MQLERLKNFFIEDCLPVWALASFDAQHGHFMESLRLDGSPETTGVVRTRTAARQIYVFAHASVLDVAPTGALEKAETAFANLHTVAWKDGGKPGYVRSFNRITNEVIDGERDLYDNACVLLALAWLYKATGKDAYRSYISAAIDAIDKTLTDPYGGWAEDSVGTLPRQQNPHMHYLEACLALCETDDCPRYQALASRLFTLFCKSFLGGHPSRLHEYFGPHWEVSDRFGSDRFSPGHMCEWVWLVRRYAKLTARDDDALCERLLATALAMGRRGPSPFLWDEVQTDGRTPEQSRRLWPQAEMLKAFLMQYRELGDDGDRQNAEAVAQSLFGSYLANAPDGCWHDRLDTQGKSTAKTIPASSLYHLWTAVVEIMDNPQRLTGFATH